MTRGVIAIGILIAAADVCPAPGQSTSVLKVERRNAGANKWTSIPPKAVRSGHSRLIRTARVMLGKRMEAGRPSHHHAIGNRRK